ncbi:hybrid sensor histidine kinase/response regulator [uncultured Sphingomonas sp.]|uniref:hybrid sensor histidine kinase/response regulator n=1 Tax=uncultured Sphingomonas sp. TaxID=158754 RepID=UPI0025F50B1B|nr:hybrid sensor histidine kinase/response regulator [uncultured Sphingomonas sp.]
MGAALSILGGISIWFSITTLHDARSQFEIESDVLSGDLQATFDKVAVRLKDAGVYIESGVANRVAEKFRSGGVRQSSYLTDMGYFDLPQDTVRSFKKAAAEAVGSAEPELIALKALALKSPGFAVALPAARLPRLFPKVARNSLIMAQASPNAIDPAHGWYLEYGVIDLERAARDLRTRARYTSLERIEDGENGASLLAFAPDDIAWWERVFRPGRHANEVLLTKNMPIRVHFQQRLAFVGRFLVVGMGILLVALLILMISTINQRIRQRQTKALQLALRNAESSNEAKSTFLANMSHEIRTPLNGVLGMAELLSRTPLNENQSRYAQQIKQSGNALLAILNDILDIAKLEEGMLAIDPVRTNIPELFQEVVTFYAGKAAEKAVSLLVEIDPAMPEFAMIDPMRLRQVLGNLLSNAIKFTERGEVVAAARADARGDGMDLVVSVQDSGIGIPAEHQSKLFQRFTQAESGTARSYGGTGLGLAICRQLVELMGGTIAFESTEGVGTTFSFRVPLVAAEARVPTQEHDTLVGVVTASTNVRRIVSDALAEVGIGCLPLTPETAEVVLREQAGTISGLVIDEGHDIHAASTLWQTLMRNAPFEGRGWAVVLGDKQAHRLYMSFDKALIKPFMPRALAKAVVDLIERNRSGDMAPQTTTEIRRPSPVAPASSQPRFGGKRLLLVDDNQINRLVGEELLRPFGFDIVTAADGLKAIEAAQNGDFDLIFMDCRMPNMDGYDATARIRASMAAGTVRRAPIVAVTANAMKGDRERCLEAGMDAFLSKPLRIREVTDVLDALVVQGMLPLGGADDTPANTAAATEPAPEVRAAIPVASALSAAPVAAPAPPPPPVPIATRSVPEPVPSPPPPSGANDRPRVLLFDRSIFDETRDAVNGFDALLEIFRSDSEEHLKTLRESLTAGEFEAAILPAHTIKSSGKIVGATGLSALAEAMETRLRNRQGVTQEQLLSIHAQMRIIFDKTLVAIDQYQSAR